MYHGRLTDEESDLVANECVLKGICIVHIVFRPYLPSVEKGLGTRKGTLLVGSDINRNYQMENWERGLFQQS